MSKIKILFWTIVFVFSTYSVTYASDVIEFPVTEETYEVPDVFTEDLDEPNEITAPEENKDELTDDKMELSAEPDIYTVIEGDNLFRIALTHEIPLDDLMSWNDLEGDLIHPGDELLVNGEEIEESKDPVVESGEKAVSSQEVAESTPSTPSIDEGKELFVTATAYTAYCKGCSGTTAYGIDLRSNPDRKVIAVDPRVIPLGTKVWVEGYGEAIAGDTGGAIKGHKIDVFIPSYERAMEWGVKKVKMKVLN
ncbi:3D domain-containing protein [Sporosarcina sp. ACRSM]|uniref:3D domain-containing protein n=1 Tax=Sporosarcina sp. ACRSM TaxID=2918216 RepID=UPI00272AE6D2|nr:3D domain-containing protein [Sporosarcina sp. ACRSM]